MGSIEVRYYKVSGKLVRETKLADGQPSDKLCHLLDPQGQRPFLEPELIQESDKIPEDEAAEMFARLAEASGQKLSLTEAKEKIQTTI
ncbi:MAG: hypothetical protein KW788_02975 [Candidatus Doudnabacteria bacterium]|nr:hypothetical protein [Candidatus Doudnabacteria bacterium]